MNSKFKTIILGTIIYGLGITLNAQTTGNWDIISGNAQTTSTNAVGLGTTTPNARFNIVNPVFSDGEGGYYSHDPLHIQFSGLSTMMLLNSSGMLGLKTNNPNSYLHLNVTAGAHNMFELTKQVGSATSRMYMDSRFYSSAHLNLNPIITQNDAGIIFSDQNLSNNSQAGFVIAPKSSTKVGLRMSSDGDLQLFNGNFTINDGTNNQCRITNSGLIISRQIDVHLDPIPDYVFHAAFDKDSASHYLNCGKYKFMPLGELAAFVETNRHLPGIKSAVEYKSAGSINVGELQLKLLEKVEELTLYNISLLNEIEVLKKKQAELEIACKLTKP
ncbi:MAG: hypothetical protein KG003_13705 [Bacteroidetes bacterium]|nr:hypothetical protein [Bacteroidota bacterium]